MISSLIKSTLIKFILYIFEENWITISTFCKFSVWFDWFFDKVTINGNRISGNNYITRHEMKRIKIENSCQKPHNRFRNENNGKVHSGKLTVGIGTEFHFISYL